MPTIALTDDELAAVTAAIRRIIADNRYPHAPRLDPLRARWPGSTRRWPQSQPRIRRHRRQPKPTSAGGDRPEKQPVGK
jgi:hypothetical protein